MNSLVSALIRKGVLKTKEIIDAFEKIDRREFVLPEYREFAYEDEAIPIGFGQTISQPYTVVFMLELLEPKNGDDILDVGSGSGWTTAIMAEIVKTKGQVTGVERIKELVEFGRHNLEKYNFPNANIMDAKEFENSESKKHFDRILVSASSSSIPEKFLKMLNIGGIMVIPVNESVCQIKKISAEKIIMKEFKGFSFVPLIL